MDYLLRFLCLLLFVSFAGCNQKEGPRLSERYNIKIELTNWLTFDYRTSTLQLKFRPNDILIDTIRFSVNELNQIKDAFEQNYIGILIGEHWIGEPKMYPTDQVKMIIYEDGELKSTFHCSPDYNGRDLKKREIASLSNILLNILYTKEVYNKMCNESSLRQDKYNEYLY